jgi:hypothetical protein
VALFSSEWDQISYFLNPFEQGEVWHPGITEVCQDFIDKCGLEINLSTLVSDTSSSVFSNYIVAKKEFWIQWKKLAEQFFEFVENYPNKKIYLATDNNETQEMFINKYGKDRIVYNVKIATSESIRQTSVKDAIIDLFACAQAFNFMGSGYSSFSGVIEKLVNK